MRLLINYNYFILFSFIHSNHVYYDGSRSRIADNIKILHPNNRIFPLFTKECPPSTELLYGVYLLNQNIAQLKHILGLNKGDLRSTLSNLLHLLTGPSNELSLRNITENTSINNNNNPSISSSSLDLDSRISLPLSKENSKHKLINDSDFISER